MRRHGRTSQPSAGLSSDLPWTAWPPQSGSALPSPPSLGILRHGDCVSLLRGSPFLQRLLPGQALTVKSPSP